MPLNNPLDPRVEIRTWIQAESLRAPGSNPASFEDLGISGVWQFANNLTRVIVCKFPLLYNIDREEDIKIQLGWSSPATLKICRWQVEYLFCGEDENMGASAQGTLTQNSPSSAVANGLKISEFTIPASAISEEDHCLLLRVSRLGNHGDDTLEAAANLSGVCFVYISANLGKPV